MRDFKQINNKTCNSNAHSLHDLSRILSKSGKVIKRKSSEFKYKSKEENKFAI